MSVKDTLFYKKKTINCNGRIISLEEPRVMSIINVTPDSFYKGSRYFSQEEIKKRIHQCIEEEADIIDVGAYSSRPFADDISEEEEIKRLDSALYIIRKEAPDAIISLDTFRSAVAEKMILHYNINIINDISGGILDENICSIAVKYNTPYIVMHMKGTPRDMQKNPQYENVCLEITTFFADKIHELHVKGISDVIIDPGFGFGKNLTDNYMILNHLEDFRTLSCPLMIGVSRKSMIYNLLNISPEEALNGSTALHMISLIKGADILRVHDVKEAREVVRIFSALKKS